MSIKVSIIVPVYNAQKTLRRCLDSLVNQTLQDIQIIAVNDASDDSSPEILEQYCQRYSDRLKIIETLENHGAGGARNRGLREAIGQYIGFVDADDYVDEHMFDKLYQRAVQDDCDMVDAAFYNTESQKAVITVNDTCVGELTTEKRKKLILNGGYIWSRIYRRDFLEKNRIFFREGVKLEDADFLMKANLLAERVGNVKEILYVYDNKKTSRNWSVNKAEYTEYPNIIELIRAIGDIGVLIPDYEDYRTVIEASILRLYLTAIQCCIRGGQMSAEDLLRLKKVRSLKKDVVTGGYDNIYVQQNIGKDGIELMKYVDGLGI